MNVFREHRVFNSVGPFFVGTLLRYFRSTRKEDSFTMLANSSGISLSASTSSLSTLLYTHTHSLSLSLSLVSLSSTTISILAWKWIEVIGPWHVRARDAEFHARARTEGNMSRDDRENCSRSFPMLLRFLLLLHPSISSPPLSSS